MSMFLKILAFLFLYLKSAMIGAFLDTMHTLLLVNGTILLIL